MRRFLTLTVALAGGCNGGHVFSDAGPTDAFLTPDVGARPLDLACGLGIHAERLTSSGTAGTVTDHVVGVFSDGAWVVEWVSVEGTSRTPRLSVFPEGTRAGTDGIVPGRSAAFWLAGDAPRRVEMADVGLGFSTREWRDGRLSEAEEFTLLDDPDWSADEFSVCEGDGFSVHLIAEQSGAQRLGTVLVDWRSHAPVVVGGPFVPESPALTAPRGIAGPGYFPARVAGCVVADGEILAAVIRGGTEPQPLLVRFPTAGAPSVSTFSDAITTQAHLSSAADGSPQLFVGTSEEAEMFRVTDHQLLARVAADGVFIENVRALETPRFTLFASPQWLVGWDRVASTFSLPLRHDGACRLDLGISRDDGDAIEIVAPCRVGVLGYSLHRIRLCGNTP